MPSVRQRQGRLKIVACRHVYRGRNQLGHEYDIYEVDAAKEDGTLVNEKLRSFMQLPIGQIVEVIITPFDSDRHGRSFTLELKSRPPASTDDDPRFAELVATVERLEQRIERLEQRPTPAAGRW